jgi:hypothetical protein
MVLKRGKRKVNKKKEDKNSILEKLYNDPESPAAFSGVERLYQEAKKIQPNITLKDVTYYLESNRIYTMHKPRHIKFRRAKFIPAGFMTDVQVKIIKSKLIKL